MIDWKDWKTYFFLLLPAVTGYITSFACHVGKDAGSKITARPPSWVFGVVWPILYIFLGLVWVILRKTDPLIIDILMSITIIGLVSWIVIYGCMKKKRMALYVLLGILISGLMIFGYAWNKNKTAGMLITPFLAWIVFATMLNYTEVNRILN